MERPLSEGVCSNGAKLRSSFPFTLGRSFAECALTAKKPASPYWGCQLVSSNMCRSSSMS